jgi:hypothetical protein
MDDLYYRIVYYQGDPKVLSVVSFTPGTSHEERDYAFASSKEFPEKGPAEAHCQALAKANGLTTKGIALPLLD